MEVTLGKKTILKKTAQVASSTLLSKFLALTRSVLEVRYFGAGAIADAFFTAYRLPNFLRKVFAEGGLGPAFTPHLIKITNEDGIEQASRLMTLMLLVVQTVILICCSLIFIFAQKVVLFCAPGFAHKPVELATAVPLARILVFFIFFVSSSALLAAAMQARNHFAIPAWGPFLLNIFYVSGLIAGLVLNISIFTFSFFIIAGGLVLLLLHLHMYFKLNFTFALPDKKTWFYFEQVMFRFLPCLFTMGALEVNMLIDNILASFLPAGSIALFFYACGFLRIPLGTFAVAFSTILLTHFSRINTYAPKRLSFYLLESTKFIIWFTFPAMLIMIFFSNTFFSTLFVSDKFSMSQATQAASLLSILLSGLFFLSLNKILLSIYYSLHKTLMPALITLVGTFCTTALNFVLMPYCGIYGLAIALIVGGAVQTVLFAYFLYKKLNINLYLAHLALFIGRYMIQLCLVGGIFYVLYTCCFVGLERFGSPLYANFLTQKIGFWLWTVPLCLGMFGVLYITRKTFNIKIYFLD